MLTCRNYFYQENEMTFRAQQPFVTFYSDKELSFKTSLHSFLILKHTTTFNLFFFYFVHNCCSYTQEYTFNGLKITQSMTHFLSKNVSDRHHFNRKIPSGNTKTSSISRHSNSKYSRNNKIRKNLSRMLVILQLKKNFLSVTVM